LVKDRRSLAYLGEKKRKSRGQKESNGIGRVLNIEEQEGHPLRKSYKKKKREKW